MKISKKQWELIGKKAGWINQPDLKQELSKKLDILNKTAIVDLGGESEQERRKRMLKEILGVSDMHSSYNSYFRIDESEILLFKAFNCTSCGTLCCDLEQDSSSITRNERYVDFAEAELLKTGIKKLDRAPEDCEGQYCKKCASANNNVE